MSVPLIGIGHDLALGSLVKFVVEPKTGNGVQYAQRDSASDYTIHERGAFCVLLWPVIDGVDQLDALLTQMGLEEDTDLRTAVTAYLPTKRRKWHRYNAHANMPQTLTYELWPTGLRIMLNDVKQIG